MNKRILIFEGNISSGKTTLISSIEKYLKHYGEKVKIFNEPLNPDFLDMYIEDKQKYAFAFQVIIARQRKNLLQDAVRLANHGFYVLIDRSILGDQAFAYMQYKKGFFTEKEYKVYNSLIFDPLFKDVSSYVRTIYLKTKPEICFERLHKRGNKNEIDGYTKEYLEDLHEAHEFMIQKEVGIEVFDWNADLAIINESECEKFIKLENKNPWLGLGTEEIDRFFC